VEDGARLAELESAWSEAWLRSEASIFQSYDWIRNWWDLCRADFDLRLGIAWRAGEIIAILPLVVHRWHGVRMLEWAAQSVSDYCDAIGGSELAFEQLWNAICDKGGFNIIRLKGVRPDAAIRPALSRLIGFAERPEDGCLRVVRQWPNGEAWYRSLNKKKRSNHVRGQRILEEMGAEPRLHQITTQPSPALISRLMDMKRQWLRANNLGFSRDILALPVLVAALSKLGVLRIFTLRRGEEVIAASINAVQGNKMLAIFATYDSSVYRASPGIILMTAYTRWAFDHGIDVVDYLRGEEAYKFEFANDRVLLRSFVAGTTVSGKCILNGYRYLKRHLKKPERETPGVGSAYFTNKGNPRGVTGLERAGTPGNSSPARSLLAEAVSDGHSPAPPPRQQPSRHGRDMARR
jgi:CelD/BcsL family acetyltransferase involved in cellulose biosynthesis